MVSLRGKNWNTLQASLERMSQQFEELGISDDAKLGE
jgi:hypothetical protein